MFHFYKQPNCTIPIVKRASLNIVDRKVTNDYQRPRGNLSDIIIDDKRTYKPPSPRRKIRPEDINIRPRVLPDSAKGRLTNEERVQYSKEIQDAADKYAMIGEKVITKLFQVQVNDPKDVEYINKRSKLMATGLTKEEADNILISTFRAQYKTKKAVDLSRMDVAVPEAISIIKQILGSGMVEVRDIAQSVDILNDSLLNNNLQNEDIINVLNLLASRPELRVDRGVEPSVYEPVSILSNIVVGDRPDQVTENNRSKPVSPNLLSITSAKERVAKINDIINKTRDLIKRNREKLKEEEAEETDLIIPMEDFLDSDYVPSTTFSTKTIDPLEEEFEEEFEEEEKYASPVEQTFEEEFEEEEEKEEEENPIIVKFTEDVRKLIDEGGSVNKLINTYKNDLTADTIMAILRKVALENQISEEEIKNIEDDIRQNIDVELIKLVPDIEFFEPVRGMNKNQNMQLLLNHVVEEEKKQEDEAIALFNETLKRVTVKSQRNLLNQKLKQTIKLMTANQSKQQKLLMNVKPNKSEIIKNVKASKAELEKLDKEIKKVVGETIIRTIEEEKEEEENPIIVKFTEDVRKLIDEGGSVNKLINTYKNDLTDDTIMAILRKVALDNQISEEEIKNIEDQIRQSIDVELIKLVPNIEFFEPVRGMNKNQNMQLLLNHVVEEEKKQEDEAIALFNETLKRVTVKSQRNLLNQKLKQTIKLMTANQSKQQKLLMNVNPNKSEIIKNAKASKAELEKIDKEIKKVAEKMTEDITKEALEEVRTEESEKQRPAGPKPSTVEEKKEEEPAKPFNQNKEMIEFIKTFLIDKLTQSKLAKKKKDNLIEIVDTLGKSPLKNPANYLRNILDRDVEKNKPPILTKGYVDTIVFPIFKTLEDNFNLEAYRTNKDKTSSLSAVAHANRSMWHDNRRGAHIAINALGRHIYPKYKGKEPISSEFSRSSSRPRYTPTPNPKKEKEEEKKGDGMKKRGRPKKEKKEKQNRKPSDWILFVKSVAKSQGLKYGDALKVASLMKK